MFDVLANARAIGVRAQHHNGGEMMKWKISTLSEEMEKYSSRILSDLMNISKSLDGNLKDIVSGTHIRIPTDAGYVNFYKSQNSFEITSWMKLSVLTKDLPISLNVDDEL